MGPWQDAMGAAEKITQVPPYLLLVGRPVSLPMTEPVKSPPYSGGFFARGWQIR
jgi:hypothetical protein